MLDDQTAALLARTARASHYGKYRGQVVGNRDPQGQGRLQVVVPALLDEQPVWAMPCTPYAGTDVGWFAMPPVGASVWVEFEAGDLDHPIWAGCFWPGSASVPGGGSDPGLKVLKTDRATITIDDNRGQIVIETSTGTRLTLKGTEMKLEALTVTIESAFGKAVLSAAGVDVNDGAFTVI